MTLRTTSLIVFALLNASPADAQHQWLTCRKTEDCVKVRTVCDGVGAINRAFVKDQAESIRRAETVVRCRPPSKAEVARNRARTPTCEAGTCGLVTVPEPVDRKADESRN